MLWGSNLKKKHKKGIGLEKYFSIVIKPKNKVILKNNFYQDKFFC